MRGINGIRALWSRPMWRRWTLAAFLGRLPVTMTLLALVLAGEEVTGSVAVGAQLAGVATLLAGVCAPWRGRMLDRQRLRAGLQRASLATAVVLAALAAATAMRMPIAVLFVLAAAQGIASAGISGGFRALLVAVVPAEELPQANTLDAIAIEVGFVAGPALAGVLALLTAPSVVLAVMAAALIAAAAFCIGLPSMRVEPTPTTVRIWREPGVRGVLGVALLLGITAGLLESSMPGRIQELGYAPGAAGPLLALIAAGSGIGGIVTALWASEVGSPRRRAAWLLLTLGAFVLPAAFTESAIVLGTLLLMAGAPIAPLNALGAHLLQSRIPAGRLGEAFSMFVAAIMVGAGIGQALTGQLLPRVGAPALILSAAVLPLLGALVAAATPGGGAPHRQRATSRLRRRRSARPVPPVR